MGIFESRKVLINRFTVFLFSCECTPALVLSLKCNTDKWYRGCLIVYAHAHTHSAASCMLWRNNLIGRLWSLHSYPELWQLLDVWIPLSSSLSSVWLPLMMEKNAFRFLKNETGVILLLPVVTMSQQLLLFSAHESVCACVIMENVVLVTSLVVGATTEAFTSIMLGFFFVCQSDHLSTW